ncbi:MAG: VWA domain-containing protein [Planctomycetota bacterium]|jgi:Mg-chelatase subunit ChlD
MDLFARPWMLVLLPAAGAAIALAEKATRASRGRVPRVILRGIVALAATLAAAGVRVPGGRTGPACVFALDVSRSTGEVADTESRLFDVLDALPARTPRAVVAFAADARVALGFEQSDDSLSLAGPGMPGTLATDIAGGLAAALGLVPRGAPAAVVLLSDGRATTGDGTTVDMTTGDAAPAALACRARGIPVFALATGAVDLPDLRVESLSAPALVEEGRPVPLVATVSGTRSAAAEAVLRRLPGGAEVGRARVAIVAGGRARVAFEDSPPTAGIVRYEAEVSVVDGPALGPDAFPENDRAEAAVMVAGVPTVLVVSRGESGGGSLVGSRRGAVAELLREAGGRFRTARRPAEAVAPSPDALAGYACVVLEGLSRDDVTPALEAALVEYVRRGGGLLATGGPAAFGAGGWRDGEPLPEALPVGMSPGPLEKTLLLIIVDASGSMALPGSPGRSKIEDAREAIATVLQAPELGPEDELALVAFRDEARVLLEPVPVARRDEVLDTLLELEADGKTSLAAPLETGLEVLGASDAKRRLALMLSDGEPTVMHSPEALAKLAGEFKSRGWALHVLGTNPAPAHIALLRSLAEAGGGTAVFESDYAKLRETVGALVRRATGRYVLPGPVEVAAVSGRDPVLAGLGEFPQLGGLVRTRLAPHARGVLASRGGEPVLAVRPFGAGRAAAFTSTFGGAWAGELGSWPGRLRFLSQLLREITPPPPDRGFTIGAGRAGRVGRAGGMHDRRGPVLEIAARDDAGAPRDLLALRVELWAAGAGVPARVEVEQVGLGRYRARVPDELARADSRTLITRLILSEDGSEREVLRAPVTLPLPTEVLMTGVDRGALAEIARASGGRLLAGPHEIAAALETVRGRERRDATPYLAAAALLAIVIELAWRALAGARAPAKGGRP